MRILHKKTERKKKVFAAFIFVYLSALFLKQKVGFFIFWKGCTKLYTLINSL